MPDLENLITAIATVGYRNPSPPDLLSVEPFQNFFLPDGRLDVENLDEHDGGLTRKEALLRYLLLDAVLDQGPDYQGVRMLLTEVTNYLYRHEIRFLHTPVNFFKELGIVVDQIKNQHDIVKEIRAIPWAKDNQSNPSRYNLFLDNTTQVLNYAVFRWGVPLAVPLILENEEPDPDQRDTVLQRYLRSYPSAEKMSEAIKSHVKYGMGKAIGNKACHLFAKWVVASFPLLQDSTPGWNAFSFEVPFDSNAGRVLWRTGFFLQWAEEQSYVKADAIQPGKGKGGLNYIRVTNIRGMASEVTPPIEHLNAYRDIAINHLRTYRQAPRKIYIQNIPPAILLASGSEYGAGHLDDGLMHIGTNYCFNHEKPTCEECPIRKYCQGCQTNPPLIEEYRT